MPRGIVALAPFHPVHLKPDKFGCAVEIALSVIERWQQLVFPRPFKGREFGRRDGWRDRDDRARLDSHDLDCLWRYLQREARPVAIDRFVRAGHFQAIKRINQLGSPLGCNGDRAVECVVMRVHDQPDVCVAD